jgi:hypothetical protein
LKDFLTNMCKFYQIGDKLNICKSRLIYFTRNLQNSWLKMTVIKYWY